MVLCGNVKFLLAGSAAFLAVESTVIYMLIFNAFILLGFGILTRKMKPCLIKKVNPLEMGGYFLAGWIHVSALVTQASNNTLAGWVCMILGFIIILMISLGFFKIVHDK